MPAGADGGPSAIALDEGRVDPRGVHVRVAEKQMASLAPLAQAVKVLAGSAALRLSGGDAAQGCRRATTGVSEGSPFRVSLECQVDAQLATPPGIANQHLTAIRTQTMHSL